MKNQFIPYEHSKMMKELGFSLSLNEAFAAHGKPENGGGLYMGSFDTTALRAPLYQQVEEWLWEKQSMRIAVIYEWSHFKAVVYGKYNTNSPKKFIYATDRLDSPITAHREGILKAIEHLHSKTK